MAEQTKSKNKKKKSVRKSRQTDYEKCRKQIISNDMSIFKKGKLKTSNGAKVTSRKQAIAIAISVADKKCKDKWTKTDFDKNTNIMKNKLKKTNYKQQITISEIQRAILQMKHLKKNKKYSALHKLQRDVMARIIMGFPPNQMDKSFSPIILRDIQKYIINEL